MAACAEFTTINALVESAETSVCESATFVGSIMAVALARTTEENHDPTENAPGFAIHESGACAAEVCGL